MEMYRVFNVTVLSIMNDIFKKTHSFKIRNMKTVHYVLKTISYLNSDLWELAKTAYYVSERIS